MKSLWCTRAFILSSCLVVVFFTQVVGCSFWSVQTQTYGTTDLAPIVVGGVNMGQQTTDERENTALDYCRIRGWETCICRRVGRTEQNSFRLKTIVKQYETFFLFSLSLSPSLFPSLFLSTPLSLIQYKYITGFTKIDNWLAYNWLAYNERQVCGIRIFQAPINNVVEWIL